MLIFNARVGCPKVAQLDIRNQLLEFFFEIRPTSSTFEFGTLAILLLDCSYDLSQIILVTSTMHTKVRLGTNINAEVETRLHQ
jgi:hypothetical protein